MSGLMKIEPIFKQEFSNTILGNLWDLNQELREIITDNSLGKLLVRIKPKFNQEIKDQNLANLLVRI